MTYISCVTYLQMFEHTAQSTHTNTHWLDHTNQPSIFLEKAYLGEMFSALSNHHQICRVKIENCLVGVRVALPRGKIVNQQKKKREENRIGYYMHVLSFSHLPIHSCWLPAGAWVILSLHLHILNILRINFINIFFHIREHRKSVSANWQPPRHAHILIYILHRKLLSSLGYIEVGV